MYSAPIDGNFHINYSSVISYLVLDFSWSLQDAFSYRHPEGDRKHGSKLQQDITWNIFFSSLCRMVPELSCHS